MAGQLESSAEALLGKLVEVSRVLGRRPDLTLHGGGNTSVKVTWRDVTGRDVPALMVKGSGHDLATIEADGFAPLRLDRVRELLPPTELGDLELADELRLALLRSSAPDPSVETLVHALLPHPAVLHSHSDAILALSNTPDGAALIEAALGESVLVVDYAMPGPELGAAVQMAWHACGDRQDSLEGIVVLQHGLFTVGATLEEALDRHLALAGRAENYRAQRRRTPSAVTPLPEVKGTSIAALRRQLSERAGRPLIVRRAADEQVARFLTDESLLDAACKGPMTPDHVIWTGRVPMVGADLAAYSSQYEDYFSTNRHRRGTDLTQHDPAPRVVLDPEFGLLTAGRNAREAAKVQDIYRHTMETISDAQDLGGYEPADAGHVFDLEYWAPQHEKLARTEISEPLAGRVAVVTGAASGIGRACAAELLEAGAVVIGWDISASVTETFDSPNWLGLKVDVTEPGAQHKALAEGIEQFGGLDIVVLAAGIFPAAQHLVELDPSAWRRTMNINVDSAAELYGLVHPLLKESPGGGRVVVVASKNVAAPGPGAAAYSASKAALTQLSRVAALEWAPDGIRVNLVHPDAVFDTALWTPELLAKRADHYGMTVEEYKRRNLLGTEVTSRSVGRMVREMAGGTFACTTGAQVPVDGGNERVI
ncbi:MAG: bifunctional aldolase/short-chain dehydrogenase [Brachybacterium sp.]|uniref:bifunctional aldolase/short-chain dehydrogenase n=1 Tax=Brachybacterium sp. TaxID=1891286 RepID=UPI003F8FA937